VIACADLGDTYIALASISGVPVAGAFEYRKAAREMYQHSLDLMHDLRHRGILDAEEVKEIDTVSHKIAECDKTLATEEER
jgi:L-amino acid N-acyltransferase YncA